MALTPGYPCLPVSEEKQDYSISPETDCLDTIVSMAPIGISCFLDPVFTSDSYLVCVHYLTATLPSKMYVLPEFNFEGF